MVLSSYEKALAFAREKHAGQYRIGGDPYITHPMEVSRIVREWGYGLEYQITALFHDLLEDTDATRAEIRMLGGGEVLEVVQLLTKYKGYVMADYIEAIRANPIARIVKAADRLHNLRSALCADDDFKRRYILESVNWYLDFSSEIPAAVKQLAESLEQPMTEFPFLYEPIRNWRINRQGE